MIKIFNESNLPWDIKGAFRKDTGSLFMTRLVKSQKQGKKVTFTDIALNRQIFDSEEALKKAIGNAPRRKLTTIFEGDTNVEFNNNHLSPYITQRPNRKNMDVVIASLRLKRNERVAHINVRQCFVLNYGFFLDGQEEEFSVFLSLNPNVKKSFAHIAIFDEVTENVKIHSFLYEDKELVHDVMETYAGYSGGCKIEAIEKYRPKKPTYHLLVDGKMTEKQKLAIIPLDRRKIFEFKNENLEEMLEGIRKKYISAITIVETENSTGKILDNQIELLTEKFSIVYLLKFDGSIKQIKY